ncbi:MAG: hybrid sensor histidine kinase/response regulator [Chloroflexota bacterium]
MGRKTTAAEEDILIVNENPAHLGLLLTALEGRGYRIRQVKNGAFALQSAFENPPHLVLVDVNLPRLDGYEVCKQLKLNPVTRHVPVIFISTNNELFDKVLAFEVGAVDFISRPFELPEVMARVEMQLTLYRQRKEIEALREKERAHYEEMTRIKDQYVQMASHDLKTPLSVIVGHTSLLAKSPNITDSRDRESLEGILEATETMRRLIRDLLDLAKIEAGMGMELEPISVNDMLKGCVFAFQYNAEEKRIALELALLKQDQTIMADHDRMVQVLSNLISNAIKYTPEDGHVKVSACMDEGALLLDVTDDGIGIPEADIPRVFERFYRVADTVHREQKGTGLGLSITKAIVEKLGGTISAKSQPNVGTRFRILLPTDEDAVPVR